MASDQRTAARIVALLEQIKADPGLLDALTEHNFGADQRSGFHVSKWLAFWNAGYDLWRLKVWDLSGRLIPYRIVYAYEPRIRQYHVLGIVHRDFGYDRNHEITQRIFSAYQDLGLKRH